MRRAFLAAGYTEAGITFALKATTNSWALPPEKAPLFARRVRGADPLHTFIKLFTLGLWVEEEEAAAPFTDLDLERLERLGLLERGSEGIHSPMRIAEHHGLLLASDAREEGPHAPRQDHVLGLNPSSLTTAEFTVRRRATRVLDVGTGGGLQALLASRHSDHVIATDTNLRALNIAAFNAKLNGISNVEFRVGNLFEPVADERFDLIVCNPPFVISPDDEFLFRDSGLPGDALCRRLIQQAPAHLAEEGFACMLCSWAHEDPDEDWTTPPRRWLEGRGCDAWLLRLNTHDVLGAAEAWNEQQDPVTYEETLERWLTYYSHLNIREITMGIVVLRRRNAERNWVRGDEGPQATAGPPTSHLLRIFEAESYLSSLELDDDLFQASFKMVEQHALERSASLEDGAYVVNDMRLTLTEGLPFWGRVDDFSLHLLTRCDGSQTLGAVVSRLAREVGVDVKDLAPQAGKLVRQLLSLGFLERVADPPTEG